MTHWQKPGHTGLQNCVFAKLQAAKYLCLINKSFSSWVVSMDFWDWMLLLQITTRKTSVANNVSVNSKKRCLFRSAAFKKPFKQGVDLSTIMKELEGKICFPKARWSGKTAWNQPNHHKDRSNGSHFPWNIHSWIQSHSWELLKLYCTYESLGGLVRNEDSESVGLGGPKTLMCKELAGEAYAAGMWTTLCEWGWKKDGLGISRTQFCTH